MKSSFRNRLSFIRYSLDAVGVVVTGLIIFGAHQLHQEIDGRCTNLDSKLKATTQFLSSENKLRAENDNLRATLDQVEGSLDALMSQLPATRNESDFLAQLAGVASRHNLLISDFRPGAVIEKAKHNEMEIRVSAEGGYTSLCQFLEGLRNIPRISRITNLNILVPEHSDDYTVELALRIYFASLEQTTENEV